MSKLLVVAQVKDPVRWEENFRTHGDLFKSYTVTKPVSFGTIEGNHVAVCFEPDDLKRLYDDYEFPSHSGSHGF